MKLVCSSALDTIDQIPMISRNRPWGGAITSGHFVQVDRTSLRISDQPAEKEWNKGSFGFRKGLS